MTDIGTSSPAGPGEYGTLLRIRPLTEASTGAVLDLWGEYVTEGFDGNFTARDPDAPPGLADHVSLDRWGPGIAMPMLPGAPRPHMPREPSYEVAQQVTAMVGNPRCRCLTAELAGVIVGFVAYSIRPLAAASERTGSIDELFVTPAARRAGIGAALAEAAAGDLRQEGIGVFHALVPKGQRYAPARRLFGRLGWERDLVAFGRYE